MQQQLQTTGKMNKAAFIEDEEPVDCHFDDSLQNNARAQQKETERTLQATYAPCCTRSGVAATHSPKQ